MACAEPSRHFRLVRKNTFLEFVHRTGAPAQVRSQSEGSEPLPDKLVDYPSSPLQQQQPRMRRGQRSASPAASAARSGIRPSSPRGSAQTATTASAPSETASVTRATSSCVSDAGWGETVDCDYPEWLQMPEYLRATANPAAQFWDQSPMWWWQQGHNCAADWKGEALPHHEQQDQCHSAVASTSSGYACSSCVTDSSSGASSSGSPRCLASPAARPPVATGPVFVTSSRQADGRKIFVRLRRGVTTEEVVQHFRKYGSIEEAMAVYTPIAKGHYPAQMPSTYGFVTFHHSSSADQALLDQCAACDNILEVKKAVPKECSASAVRKVGKVFVGGLAPETRSEDLREYFSKFGQVKDAIVMLHPTTHRSRCFGFVFFGSDNQGAKALASVVGGNHLLLGRWIDVKTAVPAAGAGRGARSEAPACGAQSVAAGPADGARKRRRGGTARGRGNYAPSKSTVGGACRSACTAS